MDKVIWDLVFLTAGFFSYWFIFDFEKHTDVEDILSKAEDNPRTPGESLARWAKRISRGRGQ